MVLCFSLQVIIMILLRRASTKSRYEQTPRYSCLNVFTRNKSRRNTAIGYWKRNSKQSHNQTLELIHQKTFDPSDQLPSSNEVKQLKIRLVSSTQIFASRGLESNLGEEMYHQILMWLLRMKENLHTVTYKWIIPRE